MCMAKWLLVWSHFLLSPGLSTVVPGSRAFIPGSSQGMDQHLDFVQMLPVLPSPTAAPQRHGCSPAGCPSAQTLSWEVQWDLIPSAGISKAFVGGQGGPKPLWYAELWVAEGSRPCGHLLLSSPEKVFYLALLTAVVVRRTFHMGLGDSGRVCR